MLEDATATQRGLARVFRNGSAESDGAREFLEERLAFFSKVIFLLCFGFYVLANLLAFLSPWQTWLAWIDRTSNQLHLAACAVLAAMWALASRGGLPPARLRLLDSCGTVLACSLYALVGWAQDLPRSEYQAVLGITNTLVARAVLVPSRASQTFWTGVFSSIPVIATCYLIAGRPGNFTEIRPPGLTTAILALWCIVAVVVSTLVSRVIYGLRREVREAMKLGQYTLEKKLGEGGMGVVYRASHALLRRPTAIKLMRREIAGELSIARFEREVQLTSLLTHPNTVAIYDYGRTPDGVFYYAMEYLQGITLEDLVQDYGPQPPGRVVYLLRQVCGSLSEAHGSGIIHRDIKAANVILCERGGIHDVVKVVDFGLVKEITNLSGVTQSAVTTVAGTPFYLPPEAIRDPASVDGRSDLYSLGVLAYFLVTGEQVFESKSFLEICTHHLHTRPIPPSVRAGRPVPSDLEELILKCLEKDPGLRPRDADALGRALEGCACAREWGEPQALAWWTEFKRRSAGDAAAGREEGTAERPGFSTATLTSPLP